MIPLASSAQHKIDFSGQWKDFWDAVNTSPAAPMFKLMSIVGVALVVFALVKWAWDRRRGGGGGGKGSGAVLGAALVGAILSAPDLLIPIGLQIVDILAGAVISIWHQAGGN